MNYNIAVIATRRSCAVPHLSAAGLTSHVHIQQCSVVQTTGQKSFSYVVSLTLLLASLSLLSSCPIVDTL